MSQAKDYILEKPEPQRSIMLRIRRLLLDALPFIEEKFMFNTPFYCRYSWVFYLTWRKKGEVDLGFVRGFELSNEQGLLEEKGRKVVRTIAFRSVEEVNQREEALLQLIHEAIIVDELAHQNKKKKKK
ncbi:MAG: DUF1801 domain-containing protein [Spirosomataceae bacterium]